MSHRTGNLAKQPHRHQLAPTLASSIKTAIVTRHRRARYISNPVLATRTLRRGETLMIDTQKRGTPSRRILAEADAGPYEIRLHATKGWRVTRVRA